MDEEITCAIVKNRLIMATMSQYFVRREVSELTEQAESTMTSYKLLKVRRYTKHAAANTATRVILTELRKRRRKVQ